MRKIQSVRACYQGRDDWRKSRSSYHGNSCALFLEKRGSVVWRPISANTGLNFKPGFFFFCYKAFHRIIHHTEKDGDWYIYRQLLAHENHKIAHKNAQKSFINFRPKIDNVAITGTNFAPQNMILCVTGSVRFERNCGKMYSRHLFPYGGLSLLFLEHPIIKM